jgi:hypothetical protein
MAVRNPNGCPADSGYTQWSDMLNCLALRSRTLVKESATSVSHTSSFRYLVFEGQRDGTWSDEEEGQPKTMSP